MQFAKFSISTTSSKRYFGSKRFVDSVRVKVLGGKGGDGCSSYEGRAIGKESPTGGHGGRGGDVLLIAKDHIKDFQHIRNFHIRGRDGKNGGGQGKSGRKGEELEVFVPCGTVVFKAQLSRKKQRELEEDGFPILLEDRNDRFLADLSKPGEKFLVARGGMPGKGNIMQSTGTDRFYFPLSAKERQGEMGTEQDLELRLKLIAQACFVGYPNAGKSSLLGAISHARPKVAAYPFTTLHPHLGYIEFDDAKVISIADLPGLVDGASENRGMGHEFLQHVERVKVLIFVLDIAPETFERENMSSPQQDLENLVEELELYQEGLSSRPSLVLVNKIDRLQNKEDVDKALNEVKKSSELLEDCHGVIGVSAKTGVGLEQFVTSLREVVEALEHEEDEQMKLFPPKERFRRMTLLPRIERGLADRRQLLNRIKRKEAAFGKSNAWRSMRKGVSTHKKFSSEEMKRIMRDKRHY